MAPVLPIAVGAYYVVVNVLGAGAVRYYIKAKSKKAAQELAARLASKGGSKLKVTGPYAGNTKRVIDMIKSAKNKATTEGSKVIKDAIQQSKTKIDKVKEKVKGFFKKKDNQPPTQKKDPTLKINKNKKNKTKITSGDPKLNKTKTKVKNIKNAKLQKNDKKGETIIQKGRRYIWTGTKWVGYSVAGAAALDLVLGMKKDEKTKDNQFVKFTYKGKTYNSYADYKKAVEADKNKKVTKTKNNEVKITNTKTGTEKKVKPKFVTQGPLRKGKRGAHSSLLNQKDRVVKKDEVKTVDNKKTSVAKTGDSWKKYTTISAAQRAGSPFFSRAGVKKAAVTKEQLEKSGLSLRDYMNTKLGKTRRK